MARFPALPLWTDAYLADTAHLTNAEHGIYLQLLMMIWRNPGCRIPNDSQWIARRFRQPVETIEKDVMPIVKEFCKSNGSWITQTRLKKEWNYLKNNSKSQSARAKSRWQKEKEVCRDDAGTMPGRCRDDAARHQSGNASTPKNKKERKKDSKKDSEELVSKNSKEECLSNVPVNKVDNGDKTDDAINSPALKAATYEKAHAAAPGYDIYFIEEQWKSSGFAAKAKNPDTAFLGFVRKHVKKNPL